MSANELPRMTNAQAQRIAYTLEHHGGLVSVHIGHAPFDLPAGYVSVKFTYSNGQQMFGGIDADGVMST